MKKWTNQEDFQLECLAGKYNSAYLAEHFKTSKKSIEARLRKLGVKQSENIEGLGLFSQSEALRYLNISLRFLKKLIDLGYITSKKKNCDNFYQLYTSEDIEKALNFLKEHCSIKEFAEIVNLSERTISKKIKDKEINILKIGRKTLIPRIEKDKFIESEEFKKKFIHISKAERFFSYSRREIYRKFKTRSKFNNRSYIDLNSI